MSIGGVLALPFPEQIAAFRLRLGNRLPTATWRDLWQEDHDRAFVVAGALQADLLADLGAAVDRAIAEGTSLETFRSDFRAIVEKNGWHGWTGEGTPKGEAWRTRVIYRTNAATSYAAGRMAQLVAGNFPLWVYRHGGSRDPRPEHLSWDGLILPPGHPFWATHAPPNGWGCSCYVIGARSERDAVRKGGKPGLQPPPGFAMPDPRTGAPKGIDTGWAYAPGASVSAAVNALAAKPVNWDYSLAVAFMRSLPSDGRDQFSVAYRALPSLADDLSRWAARVSGADPTEASRLAAQRTMGLATTADAATISDITGEAAGEALLDWTLDQNAVVHVLSRHGDPQVERSRGQRQITAADFRLLPFLINAPDVIELAEPLARRGPVVRLRKVIGDEEITALFELRRRRRRLALVTFWIRLLSGAPPTATP